MYDFELEPYRQSAYWDTRNLNLLDSQCRCSSRRRTKRKTYPCRNFEWPAENGDTGDLLRWHVRKDGRLILVDGILTALYDEDGFLLGFSKVMRDGTDKHLAAKQLKAKKERLEQVAAMLSLAPAIVRQLDGKILLWNEALTLDVRLE